METRKLDGKRVSDGMKAQLAEELEALRRETRLVPGLAVVLVGDNPASRVYVRSKAKACADLGMHSESLDLPGKTTEAELLEIIDRLNEADEIDGILVQLPLPPQINTDRVLAAIRPDKDVDGFHPENMGKLLAGKFTLAACTPMGIMEMLHREGVPIKGAEAVIVGRSNIVGKPMALLLLHEHATVTICHSRTRDLPAVCRRADILVAAIGRPAFVTRDFVKEGAVVIDVGINRVTEREEVERLFGAGSERMSQWEQRGSTLVGDVHPRELEGIAAAITPVPGGVGPLTIAQLLKNTLLACRARRVKLPAESAPSI
jgi:methylenetetrahydrofolate dehydrogenase (NADP+) / methenyltetrahydrofolate cyclohydrolase